MGTFANDLKIVERVFESASLDELLEMHSRLTAMVNHKRRERSARAVMQFRPGQKVSFTGRRGIRRVGVVERVNQTTVSVSCEPLYGKGPAEPWRVSASMLKVVS